MEKKIRKSFRPKTFTTMESLWYEEERLATFIDWPVKYISEVDLAAEGFYYLRTKDHCACAFCCGIIGAWEEGDTPKGEHKRHFKQCPFVKGEITPNVPINLANILAKCRHDVCRKDTVNKVGEDVCGTMMNSSKNESHQQKFSSLKSLECMGFKEYCGPKRKDYLTPDSRYKSFKQWPDKVQQNPLELADAGFYYCGLSDHVRCFHCGNGLRNWEPEDKPWEEHARWYPDCHYMMLKKGAEFIDKVRRENPPYVPTFRSNGDVSSSSAPPYEAKFTDEEMERLLDLRVTREVLAMGFARNNVITALKRQLESSGAPFFSLETAIETVLAVMEEETKDTINGCEYITSQVREMADVTMTSEAELPTEGERAQLTQTEVTTEAELPTDGERTQSPVNIMSNSVNGMENSAQAQFPPISSNSSSPPLRSSTPTSEAASHDTATYFERVNGSGSEGGEISPENRSVTLSHSTQTEVSPAGNPSPDYMMEANKVIEKVSKLLAPPPTTSTPPISVSATPTSELVTTTSTMPSSSPSSSQSSEGSSSTQDSGIDNDMEDLTGGEDPQKTNATPLARQKSIEISQELEEAYQESMTCQVCMDDKKDIVFLPCMHVVTCSSCAVALTSCPVCRGDIQYALKLIIT